MRAALLLLLALAVGSQSQLMFVVEPPARLSYSSGAGARVECAAHGDPPPLVTWLSEDGAPLTDIPGLRSALPNGTLWVAPFTAAQYRSDVHAAVYRCRAASSVGAILSRDMRLDAVMDEPWEVRAEASQGVAGGAAVVTCVVSANARAHVVVTAWLRDGAALPPAPPDTGGRYIVGGSRGEVLVVRRVSPDDGAAYSCEAQHSLTGEKRRSDAAVIPVSHATGSMAPRIMTVTEDVEVQAGADVRLVCCAIGSPPPTYSWFRQSNGRLSGVASSARVSVWGEAVVVRTAQAADAGVWTCRAHNQYGEQRRDARLSVKTRLVVAVHPQLQVANSGSSVMFTCSVEGGEGARVRWVHDGAPAAGGGGRELHVRGVARAHRGMYQCFAERDRDTAQAAAELRLGDTAPELHYTFIEQALHPGPALTLHCAASATPPPRFTWLLDGQPLEELHSPHRSISQLLRPSGDVVSFLNISSVRAEDGGRYTCRAHNTRGAVEHSARLNVYGPPSIRGVGPLRVVAGLNTTIYCPFSGFPISEIRWQRGGGAVVGARGGADGALRLWPAEPHDAGLYSCRVTAPGGQYAQKDLQIIVRNPPKISGFTFPSDLVEGSSIQVLCGITSGDKPVYFSWLKDGQHIPSNLQVQEKSLDEFSFLIFSHVTSQHSGEYTCVATNSAAEVNHTARLAVKVAPSWAYEPQDVSALLGTQIHAHCSTKGYPEPRVTWLKEQGTGGADFRPIPSMDLQYSVSANGSLVIGSAARHHEGQYMCRADNGIGRGISKIINISVNEPAHFEYSSRNMTVKRTAQATLQCDARGDPPIQLQWTHNMKRVDLTTYRISVSEKRSPLGVSSTLTIGHAARADSGVYRCRAENAYGRDELLIYLAVQELPEAPAGVAAAAGGGRGARVRWRRGYDGNAPVRLYRLQYRAVGAHVAPDWSRAPTTDLPAHTLTQRQEWWEGAETVWLEHRVEGLRPATAYALRVAAVNDIGQSHYSDTVILHTLPEAPSEPPHNVQVQATTARELLVKWQPPPQESWNGELLGYAVWWRGEGNSSRTLTVAGWAAAHAALPSLEPHTHYHVQVLAYNAVGPGPPSPALTAATLEGAPESGPARVQCAALSSTSMRVWWEPPPPTARAALLLGYEILYEVSEELESWWESRRSGGLEAVVAGLRRGARYCVRVRARAAAGPGPPAPPVCCDTHDDVPGAPADIKVSPHSEDSVVVSWLAPAHKNGVIKHYTVYSRPQRTGQVSQLTVPASAEGREGRAEVRRVAGAPHEFWVTAATARGEGDISTVLTGKPQPRAPAKLTSFSGRIVSVRGRAVRLQCGVAGAGPLTRGWTRARAAAPLEHDHRYTLQGDQLLIHSVDRSTSDNYSCVVRNPWGEERGWWEVRAVGPPAAPRLVLAAVGHARAALAWDPPAAAPDAAPVHGYLLEYRESAGGEWVGVPLGAEARGHSLERLSCGRHYRARLTALSAAGPAQGDELAVDTKGGPPKPPAEKDLISTNSTCASINLVTWDSNGCPLNQFVVSTRGFDDSGWRRRALDPSPYPAAVCGLRPAAWYQLQVEASTDAGTATGNYYFSTLNEDGERIPAPSYFPPAGGAEGGGRLALAGAAAASLLAALTLLAALAHYRGTSTRCFRKGYEQGVASSEEDNKSVEKRDNRRNCQQVYTSSPIKQGKKDQQEMYEISPYATFSMSGGATGPDCGDDASECGAGAGAGAGAAAVGGGTLRTFGRAEPPLLQAAPPHLHRGNNSEEYTLSRAMTLVVRRGESDSESSAGSPCAECASARYRNPLSEESSYRASSSPGSVTSSATRGAASGAASGAPSSAVGRRRPRRHAPDHRYPRQEQERRDFTIHV